MAEQELSLKSLRLAGLPEFDPPPQLWARIEAAHARRRQQRRLTYWSAAAGVVLAVAGLVAVVAPPAPARPSALLQLERQSQELEQVYAGLAQPFSPLESEVELHAIETALQQAYDRGAAAEELAPLWEQRNAVLSSLIALSADGAQLTRI
ncbi:hypothetical protein [Tahibacter harae]|uniref:Anti-sigma factor n=1 Tax=Tahibacter harae TaxID=2963937 RepID=A0ABT1QXN4_9GAMM|nr:hypothetical protein [Tahibacter harae]MCQ4167041.1 hypothetical protein [Tahibacter harae]